MIPVIIMGGILFGLFTPTEAAAVAVVYALVVPPIFYREPALRELPAIFADSARLSGVIGLIIGFVGAFGWVLTYSKFPFKVAEAIAVIAPEWWLFLILIIAALPDPRHVPHALRDHPGDGAGAAAGGPGRRRPPDPFRHRVRRRLRGRPHHAAGGPVPVRRHGHQRPAHGQARASRCCRSSGPSWRCCCWWRSSRSWPCSCRACWGLRASGRWRSPPPSVSAKNSSTSSAVQCHLTPGSSKSLQARYPSAYILTG